MSDHTIYISLHYTTSLHIFVWFI